METLIYTTHSPTGGFLIVFINPYTSPGVLYCSLYGPIVCRQIYVIA